MTPATTRTGSGPTGSDLTEEQQDLLFDMVASWAGLAGEDTTAEALTELEAPLDETYGIRSGASK